MSRWVGDGWVYVWVDGWMVEQIDRGWMHNGQQMDSRWMMDCDG